MPDTPEKFSEVEDTLKSTLNPLLAMAGVANPLTAAVMFGVGIIFRFVRIGAYIRKQNKEAEKALDAAVRTEGIFRVPISINLDFTTLINFTMRECALLYPLAFKQLEPERKLLLDKSDPRWKEAFETLELAYRILPEVYFDQKFDNNAVLDDIFGKWLDPGNPDFGGLLRELRVFLSTDELSTQNLQAMLPTFVKQRLKDMGVAVEGLTEESLAHVTGQVGAIVSDALTGEDGLLQETLGFAVGKREEALQNQLEDLAGKKDELQAVADSERNQGQFKELEQVNRRISDVENMLSRISEIGRV